MLNVQLVPKGGDMEEALAITTELDRAAAKMADAAATLNTAADILAAAVVDINRADACGVATLGWWALENDINCGVSAVQRARSLLAAAFADAHDEAAARDRRLARTRT